MDPRAGLDGRKISSPTGFDLGPFSPKSVAIPTELPGPLVCVCSSRSCITEVQVRKVCETRAEGCHAK